jgi:tetratricopeptide (TPR) repeat protein
MKCKLKSISAFCHSFLRRSMWGAIAIIIFSGCFAENKPKKQVRRNDSMAILLAPHRGGSNLDRHIHQLQEQIRSGKGLDVALERLGWAFVSKARESFDPGFYKLAEQCALALDNRQPRCAEGLLLRGHVLQNLHRFEEAETLARELILKRGLPFDYGLLSDALMEQGELNAAIEACQKMVDLRPDLHSYARGAHLRWLKGDLAGAENLMRMAVDASSPRDPDSAAWVFTRLAGYQFQSGAMAQAEESCASAFQFRAEYPPALLLLGRLFLAGGKNEQASDFLGRAARLNPLPEYQWALAESLRAVGRDEEASKVERALCQQGAAVDPRTYSVYLATRSQSADLAVRLAREELGARKDVFTHDALAWALASAGKVQEARQHSSLALAQGTQDARLFLHAAALASKTGCTEEVQRFAAQAKRFSHTLLPSERALLKNLERHVPRTVTPHISLR